MISYSTGYTGRLHMQKKLHSLHIHMLRYTGQADNQSDLPVRVQSA